MSIFDKLFGGKRNPAEEAGMYLDQIPGQTQPYYQPFIDRGGRAGGVLEQQYGDLVSDPQGFINKAMQDYTTSDYYDFQKGQLQKELGAAAAAGGFRGNVQDQIAQGGAIQGLLSKDMQDYLANVLGLYKTGLAGEQGFYDTGFDASKGFADIKGNVLGQKAGLAYGDAQQANANRSALIKSLLQGASGLAGFATSPTMSVFGNKLWG